MSNIEAEMAKRVECDGCHSFFYLGSEGSITILKGAAQW